MYTGGVFRFVYLLLTKTNGFRYVCIQTRFLFVGFGQAEIAMRQAGKAGMSDEEVLIRFN